MKTKFGSLAKDSAFFNRVLESLLTPGGLSNICATFADNVPLHGTSDQNPGIDPGPSENSEWSFHIEAAVC